MYELKLDMIYVYYIVYICIYIVVVKARIR